MKRIFIFLLIVVLAFAAYWFIFRKTGPHIKEPKLTPVGLKKHSLQFNSNVDSLVNAYLAMKNAFVEADMSAAKKADSVFIARLDHFPIDEMKKDTAMVFATVQANLADIKSNAESLLKQINITEMRRDFSAVTEQMFPSFFTAINYEGPTLYFENCPMAFDDSVSANWISNSEEIVNPYLGKNNPKYHSGVVGCGEVKDSIVSK
jgi:hypothetical protein